MRYPRAAVRKLLPGAGKIESPRAGASLRMSRAGVGLFKAGGAYSQKHWARGDRWSWAGLGGLSCAADDDCKTSDVAAPKGWL